MWKNCNTHTLMIGKSVHTLLPINSNTLYIYSVSLPMGTKRYMQKWLFSIAFIAKELKNNLEISYTIEYYIAMKINQLELYLAIGINKNTKLTKNSLSCEILRTVPYHMYNFKSLISIFIYKYR